MRFATQGAYGNVQTAQSDDLVHWQRQADAMRILPTWIDVGQPNVWAPGVIQVGSRFLLFYTAHDSASDRQCIGLATATQPLGPYRDQSSTPFLCQFKLGGSIDPMPLADGGKLYLYWKNDGNCCGITTQLFGQALSPDGTALQGDPVALTETNAYWEGNVIEAPDMVHHGSGYYLFFSANDYRNASYAVGYATCDGPLGPCTQAPENPILASRIQTPPLVIGTGGETVIQDGSQTWMLYHAWNVTNGVRGDYRYLWLDPLVWIDGRPVVEGPTTYPEPVPPTPEATP